ncbi:MAG TPA: family 43 glycosylhydrolase [Opitutaceae bacterium]|nr:family 43 glycosylhydrolase [Opitutaceae bacterium]
MNKHNSSAAAVRLVALCMLLGLFAPGAWGASHALTGALGAHDPTIIQEGQTWWVFSTGTGLPVKYSPDGLAWTQGVQIFAAELPWWRTYAPTMGQNDVWAPDVHYFGGRFWCYYCVSEFGTNNSAIGLTSCTSIAKGDWRDDGVVLSSESGAQSFNALDPDLAVDAAGNPWLVFGSFFDGIHVVALDPATMKPTGTVSSIAARPNGIEGSNIIYNNGYYYLFVSIDKCCLGVNSTYKIAYGRSTGITGPYVDQSGVPMLQSGGTVLDSSGPRWIGPGGQSIYHSAGGWIMAFHAYDAMNNGNPTLMISDLYWDAGNWPTLTQPAAPLNPVFTTQPLSVEVAAGTVALDAVASSATSYQWMQNGVPVAGAAGPTLVLTDASAAPGSYACVASNSTGSATSETATVGIIQASTPTRMVNISARAEVGTGPSIIFGGFAVGGGGAPGTVRLLIRGSGPAIAAAPFNVPATLPDPQLRLFDSGGSPIPGDLNTGWAGNTEVISDSSAVGAFKWNDPASHDAALDLALATGPYTAQISGENADTGVSLMEVYDATPDGAFNSSSPRLVNLSARVLAGSGPNALFAGFVIKGTAAMTVLIRASGPALAPFGVSGVLPDPQLTLQNQATGAVIAANTGWAGNAAVSDAAGNVGAFRWNDPASRDSALLITLPPGNYTAEVAGAGGDSGIILVEVYEVR